NPGESWLHLYDRDPAGGSCAILADPEVVNGWTLQGGRQNRQLTLTARVRPETRTLRFLLWEFQENTHTHDSAQAWLLEQAEALLQTVRTPPPEAADTRVAYRTVQTPEAPTLDGQADDPAWSLAEWSDSFLDLRSGRPVSPGTRFKSVYDLKHLYFLIRCEEPEPDQISASFREQDDAHLFRDDSIEIFLGPQNSALNYLHFAFNAAGSRWEAIQFPREARTRTDWNPEWDVAVSRDATGWTAEVRLPLLSLLLTADLDERWMLNLARNRAAGRGEPGHSAHQTWSRLTSGAFHEAESFNEMTGFDLEMAAYQQPEAFRSYGMRADKRGSPWGAGLELVRPGSDHLMLYYPNGTLFLPSDGTVLRSIFLFKETRPEVRETMEGRKGEAASRELLKNLSFHFRLPPGATLA
ncbi:MAG: sugar-binding protein, partial [Kiritimatiellia bacterium]|nr:sugar-binding protein [Kiritimatiellia bacterium]